MIGQEQVFFFKLEEYNCKGDVPHTRNDSQNELVLKMSLFCNHLQGLKRYFNPIIKVSISCDQ